MTKIYTTETSDGSCGHKHRSLSGAVKCGQRRAVAEGYWDEWLNGIDPALVYVTARNGESSGREELGAAKRLLEQGKDISVWN